MHAVDVMYQQFDVTCGRLFGLYFKTLLLQPVSWLSLTSFKFYILLIKSTSVKLLNQKMLVIVQFTETRPVPNATWPFIVNKVPAKV